MAVGRIFCTRPNLTLTLNPNPFFQAKKEVRRLFVNCCRVHPEPCLQLISMALSALPQPLSTGKITLSISYFFSIYLSMALLALP
jgi:hypothetical protein